MRPNAEGLVISPSIPAEWDGFKIEKIFRGSRLHITVKNPDHAQSGCKSLTLNGKLMEDNYIPASELKEENEIELVM